MTTEAEIAEAIRTALANSASGAAVVSVSVNGVTTTFDRKAALDLLHHYERHEARETGARRRMNTIDLRGVW